MSKNFPILKVSRKPSPSVKGVSEGHGEGVEYGDYTGIYRRYYFYRDGKKIPKNKIVSLKWEGDYCGRVHGDTHYIIVGYDKNGNLRLIKEVDYYVREELRKLKGLTVDQAIEMIEKSNEAKMKDVRNLLNGTDIF